MNRSGKETRRRWRRAVVLVVLAMLAALLSPLSPQAAAVGTADLHRIFGNPDGQEGLRIARLGCGSVPPDDTPWQFRIIGGSPSSWGPHAVGWTPSSSGDAQGVEAHFDRPTRVDTFRMLVNAVQGAEGFAHVWYQPPQAGRMWQGVARFTVNEAGWTSFEAGDTVFDWYRHTNGQFDGTLVPDQTIRAHSSAQGGDGGGAWFAYYLGCDGAAFAIDGLEIGSSADGWEAYNFDGYKSTTSLRSTRTRSTCQTSPAAWPNKMSFRGTVKPSGKWLGWQYRGVRGKRGWKLVAKGSTSGAFRFSARVAENSHFAATHPPHGGTEFSESPYPYLYVPAFPSISMRASTRSVRKGQRLVITGSMEPRERLSYTVLRSEAGSRRWGPLRSLGTRTTDRRGRFTFPVPTSTPGIARIHVITKTEKDLTSTIHPRGVVYEVLKPKKKKKPPPQPPADQTDNDTPTTGNDETNPGGPPGGSFRGRKGYGACQWRVTADVPKGRSIDGILFGTLRPGIADDAPLPYAPARLGVKDDATDAPPTRFIALRALPGDGVAPARPR